MGGIPVFWIICIREYGVDMGNDNDNEIYSIERPLSRYERTLSEHYKEKNKKQRQNGKHDLAFNSDKYARERRQNILVTCGIIKRVLIYTFHIQL